MESECFLKTGVYSAIQYTGSNRRDIIDFLKIGKEFVQSWKNADTNEQYLFVSAPQCNLGKILQDQWILLGKYSKAYNVLTESQFSEMYESR